jgi:gamma-glutamylcyclotransferase (GGCT)/AIG2-like uncharacterized protein YtfP
MKQHSPYLFVYGSLRQGFQSPAYNYVSQYFEFVSMAKVKGILYDLGVYPVAVPDKKENYIIGELYRLKRDEEFDWAFAQLDDYEGVIVEEDEEQMYRRDMATIYFDGGTIEAWVYWFNGKVKNCPVIASGDLLEYIKGKQ